MTTLDELFNGERRTTAADPSVVDENTSERLERQLGAPRASGRDRATVSTGAELSALVRAASQRGSAGGSVPMTGGTGEKRRERGRFDVIGLSCAGLALAAVLTAGAVGVVQAATADPTTAAVEALRHDEGVIQNAMTALEKSQTSLGEAITAEATESAALRVTLEELRATLHPRQPEGEDVEPVPLVIVPVASIDAAVAELLAYEQALAEIELPAMPGAYTPASVDSDSLASVADAVDLAQTQIGVIEAAADEVRSVRNGMTSLTTAHDQVIATFAASFGPAIDAINGANLEADAALRDTLWQAGQLVINTALQGPEGNAAVLPVRDAVIALLVDQQRVLDERAAAEAEAQRLAAEEEARRLQQQQQQQQQQQPPAQSDPGTGDPGTGDPGTGDPGTGDPGTGDPEPSPEPTDPVDPGTGDTGNSGVDVNPFG